VQQHYLKTAIGLIVLCFASSAANAHGALEKSAPARDAAVSGDVKEIRLDFSESVIAKLSGIELKDQGGKTITTGAAVNDPKDKKKLVVPLQTPLQAGAYTVNWHAVSDDTHRVKGSYSFKVQP
jgi:copper resistance protein C